MALKQFDDLPAILGARICLKLGHLLPIDWEQGLGATCWSENRFSHLVYLFFYLGVHPHILAVQVLALQGLQFFLQHFSLQFFVC